ncbi:MAG: UDP-glucose/GDP-mannose dehydrogenase family protein [Gammaproteobacteria bacterium]|nr:UDP-glucose/GDP-mannose dehydrogenase family protein [Gammaproteobacteria bacterium]MDP2140992.1 UDP-glucose/GDP-mannose dehydrogenase family protein [Gammaproteobacteria bacterium]MDP2349264.1 UDP-glucose/GDP-mannose dehydrogenase family protein [Gammaproteobacteria bacterium]
MKITIFGTGYVGLVSGACLAECGHQVMCMDVDAAKIDSLKKGVIPIYEPGLESMVGENAKAGTLFFTSNPVEAVGFADIIFIAVGTPPDEDGSADLSYVLAVASEIGRQMQQSKIVVTKSTVPVGTSDKVRAAVQAELDKRGSSLRVEIASNPEFLKEGAAVSDFMKPDRIVVGAESAEVKAIMQDIYAPFNRNSDRMIFMDIRSAELTKYAANAMLATKISFMNEIANLAEILGADIEQVRHGIGSDPRIGYQFIYPGIGYGGSCFPKDVRALSQTGLQHGREMRILNAVEAVNDLQKSRLAELVMRHYAGASLLDKTFAVWGLSFKPKTDDMREAPSRVVIEALWAAGATVQAYDPEAMDEVERIYGHRDDLRLVGTRDAALIGADALIICTEWQHFRAADFDNLAVQLADKVVFDGRNMYDPAKVATKGLIYYGIGRGASVAKS